MNFCALGSVQKHLGGGGGGGGLGKVEEAEKVLSCPKRGTNKFSVVKGGGSKKFCQIYSIMKFKMHICL